MVTSSIFHNVVVKNDKECERLINALELSEKGKEGKLKHPQVFFISDLHLGHKNCLAFDNRPYLTIEEQDKDIIKKWNSRVSTDDIVYILGDISWYSTSKTIEILKQLNGYKHLIVGNHDKKLIKSREFRSMFESINDYQEVVVDNQNIVLSHYSIPCFNKHFYGSYHFYGHVHNSFEWNMMRYHRYLIQSLYTKPCNMFNVGCMIPYIDYTPRTFNEIIYQTICDNVKDSVYGAKHGKS